MLRPSDKIMAPGRGDVKAFIRWVKALGATGPYADWAYTVQQVCDEIGIDRAIIWFQAQWECQFQGHYWEEGNSGGLGIDADGWPTPFDINPNAGGDSALVHVATMWAMIGNTRYPKVLQPARQRLAPDWLSRVERMVTDPNRPAVAQMKDLNIRFRSVLTGDMEATWAWDAEYVTGICARANASGINIPDQSIITPVQRFPKARLFHAVQGAVARLEPSTDSPIMKRLEAGSRVWCYGTRTGERPLYQTSNRWLVTAGANHWHIHPSGLKEAV